MGKFLQFLTELSARDNNLSKYQCISTKLGMCIAIVEIWFGIANRQISFRDTSIFSFQDNNLSKSQWIFTQLDMCIDIPEIWFGIVIGYISSYFDRVISP